MPWVPARGKGSSSLTHGKPTKADVQLAPHDAAQPTEVLPKFLYLGSYDHASRSELLKVMDITHILNVSPCAKNTGAQ